MPRQVAEDEAMPKRDVAAEVSAASVSGAPSRSIGWRSGCAAIEVGRRGVPPDVAPQEHGAPKVANEGDAEPRSGAGHGGNQRRIRRTTASTGRVRIRAGGENS